MSQTKVTTPPVRFSVVLDDIRSILNVGAIFRTADAVGVGMIYLAGYTPGPDTHPEKMAKTALGARVPWVRVARVGDAVRKLRKAGVQVVVLEQAVTSQDYRKFKPKFPLALVLGNEVKGVRHVVSHNVDAVIELPMRGGKESLNVAVAFGIAAYELTRRW